MSVTRGGYKRGNCFTPWQSDRSLTLTHPIHCLLLYGKYVSNFQALVTGALETSHAAIRHLHTEGRALAIKDFHSNNIGTPINIHTCSHYSVLF